MANLHLHRFSFALALFVTASCAAQAQNVGSVSAVNVDAKGTPPGAGARTLLLGGSVVRNERIQTDSNGTAQITFTDRSSMAVGRNSSVVVNDYVYNPSSGAGAQASSLLRGSMRFVGGQVSHGDGAKVTTPVAALGVRGGVATIVLEPAGAGQPPRLRVINHYGTTTISNAAGRFVLGRNDAQAIVDGPNSPPRGLGLVDPGFLAQIDAQMTSASRQQGGAQTRPTDAMMARNGVRTPRPAVEAPNFDVFAAGDNAVRTRGPAIDYLWARCALRLTQC